MAHWLLKTDPETYSFDDLVRDKKTFWDGVRNFQARNFMRRMKKGDAALIYHSGTDRAVMGTARILSSARPDPTDKEKEGWVVVDVAAGGHLARPVPLAAMKKAPALAGMLLLRQSRLSVMPVTAAEFKAILTLGAKA